MSRYLAGLGITAFFSSVVACMASCGDSSAPRVCDAGCLCFRTPQTCPAGCLPVVVPASDAGPEQFWCENVLSNAADRGAQ
ncbi:MAG TPA: hypothetical protein VG963_23785 [Polyangiaceae bacterium]|nr:hypothetical protein [Polyangiaceae bacterium]